MHIAHYIRFDGILTIVFVFLKIYIFSFLLFPKSVSLCLLLITLLCCRTQIIDASHARQTHSHMHIYCMYICTVCVNIFLLTTRSLLFFDLLMNSKMKILASFQCFADSLFYSFSLCTFFFQQFYTHTTYIYTYKYECWVWLHQVALCASWMYLKVKFCFFISYECAYIYICLRVYLSVKRNVYIFLEKSLYKYERLRIKYLYKFIALGNKLLFCPTCTSWREQIWQTHGPPSIYIYLEVVIRNTGCMN